MNVKILKAALFENGLDKNVLAGVAPAFLKYNRNGLDNISINFASSLNKDELNWAFDLAKANMEAVYDASGYGWDDDDKRSELTEEGTRFLMLRDESLDDKPLIGFVHFRFTVQGEVLDTMAGAPTLYIWDIHIEDEYQRKGLGKHLLIILELIARQQKMQLISIPIQDEDEIAASWIDKVRGYGPDKQLKTLIGFDSEVEGFQVFAKYFQTTAAAPTKTSVIATSKTATADVTAKDTKTSQMLIQVSDDVTVSLEDALEQLKDCYRSKNNSEPTQDMIVNWESTLKSSCCESAVAVSNMNETLASATAAVGAVGAEPSETEEVEGFQFINISDVPKE